MVFADKCIWYSTKVGREMFKLKSAAVGLCMAVMVTSGSTLRAMPLDFNWSLNTSAGVFEGMVFGLTDNSTSAASDVSLTAAPGFNFTLPFSFFSDLTSPNIQQNSWTVSNGELTAIQFVASDNIAPIEVLIILTGASLSPLSFAINDGQSGLGQSSFTVSTSAKTIAEPTTLAILGLGLAGLGYARRRKAA